MVTYLAGGIIRSGGNTKMIKMIDIAGNINHLYHFCIAAASYDTASKISNHF